MQERVLDVFGTPTETEAMDAFGLWMSRHHRQIWHPYEITFLQFSDRPGGESFRLDDIASLVILLRAYRDRGHEQWNEHLASYLAKLEAVAGRYDT